MVPAQLATSSSVFAFTDVFSHLLLDEADPSAVQ